MRSDGTVDPPIRRLLVANRGELVVRVARTCRSNGITCLALVTDDEREAWWTRAADEIVPLATGYLDAAAIVKAAAAARADAIHPGYGFLAESAGFADLVVDSGLVWVGPPASAMRRLGDKAAARAMARDLGIPLVEGYDGSDQADARLWDEADRIGYPVLLKPSAGGGGKGMHVVRSADALPDTLRQARREAGGAFNDERLIVERYVERPRHVEVQLLFDGFGDGVHLGERDCTLQRRHQKVVEEAPAPAIGDDLRERLAAAALRMAAAAGYVGAGTVEFLVDDGDHFFFLELNARLQVEHPVTELTTGRDLVADQLRIAAGLRLGFAAADVTVRGHAIEARLYAEDPFSDFLPATGKIAALRWPDGAGVRVDAGVGIGDVVGTRYDPLLAKIVAHGPDRGEALARITRALEETRVAGVTTNRGFLVSLLRLPEVAAADHRTETIATAWRPDPSIPDTAWASAATALSTMLGAPGGPGPGFRLNAPPVLRLRTGNEERVVAASRRGALDDVLLLDDGRVVVDIAGRAVEFTLAPAPSAEEAVHRAGHQGAVTRAIEAPMPGTVLAVRVAEGEQVEAHAVLVVLEAMKMENPVTAPTDGRVERVLVRPGMVVQRGEPLVELG